MNHSQHGPAPGAAELGRRAGHGARWSALGNAGKNAIDLAVFVLLAHHVAPAAFGLVAMAAALIVLVNVIAALGLGEALVQRDELEPAHADSAFWCTLGVAATLAALIAAAAPWLAAAYGQPTLAPVLRALTPLLLLQGLAVVPQALLQREFAFRALGLRLLAASVCGGAAGIGLALGGAGVWSLVVQQLLASGIGLLALWGRTRWRPRWRCSHRHAAELLVFGRSVIGARLLNVAASKADDLVVGLVLGPVALGYYSVACRMLLALEQLFCQGIDAVALSAFSRLQSRRDELRALFLRATTLAAALAFPVFGGLALLAPQVVALVFGPAWLPSAPLLQVLLVAGALQALMHFNHAVFKACGQPGLSLRLALWSTGLNVLTLAVAVRYGIVAVAVSYLLRSVLIAPLGLWQVRRLLDLPLAQYFRPWAPVLAAVAAAAAVVRGLQAALPATLPAPAALALLVVAGAAVYLLACRALGVLPGLLSGAAPPTTVAGPVAAALARPQR